MAKNKAFKLRPLNTPRRKIKLRQLTQGGEYMLMQEDEQTGNLVATVEYIGLYHIYPNGAVYTGAVPSPSAIPLTRYFRTEINANGQVNTSIPENNTVYAKLTNERFYNYVTPKTYYPELVRTDYDRGTIQRHFAKKINDDKIIEISPAAADSANERNLVGIDDVLYIITNLTWTISGPIEEVRKANLRSIAYKETDMPGLSRYLQNPTEFHK